MRSGRTNVPAASVMFMTNSMLLWWSLDSVPLPLAKNPKVAKEAASANAKLRQSNRTDKRNELNAITSLLLNATFIRRTLT